MDARELLARYEPRLLARIRWMMGEDARRRADSVDFRNTLVAKILERASSLEWRSESHFLNLATRMARNLMVDQVRRPRVKRFESFSASMSGVAAGGESPPDGADRAEAGEKLLEALESLSPDDQQVIELRYFEDLPFKEVAAKMGRSEAAAQQLNQRALARLGRILRR